MSLVALMFLPLVAVSARWDNCYKWLDGERDSRNNDGWSNDAWNNDGWSNDAWNNYGWSNDVWANADWGNARRDNWANADWARRDNWANADWANADWARRDNWANAGWGNARSDNWANAGWANAARDSWASSDNWRGLYDNSYYYGLPYAYARTVDYTNEKYVKQSPAWSTEVGTRNKVTIRPSYVGAPYSKYYSTYYPYYVVDYPYDGKSSSNWGI